MRCLFCLTECADVICLHQHYQSTECRMNGDQDIIPLIQTNWNHQIVKKIRHKISENINIVTKSSNTAPTMTPLNPVNQSRNEGQQNDNDEYIEPMNLGSYFDDAAATQTRLSNNM